MIEQITLTDFLSFGPDSQTLKLRPLNVLIGPNGAWKLNLRISPEAIRKLNWGKRFLDAMGATK